eukprot:5445362-Karenia_brevis.AAC.1
MIRHHVIVVLIATAPRPSPHLRRSLCRSLCLRRRHRQPQANSSSARSRVGAHRVHVVAATTAPL